jgi:O-antigen/teichoic acid export membrane protein
MEPQLLLEEENKLESPIRSISLTNARKRFVLNVISNVAYIGAQAFLTLWMTPFFIGYLGLAAYGMIPLIQNVIAYTAVLTTAFDTAVSRYLTIELGRGDEKASNKTFNTALFSIIGLFIIISPVLVIIALLFPSIFNVPIGWETDAKWLVLLTAISFLVSVTGGIFAVSTYVHSEFLKLNIVNFIGLFSRIIIIIALFSLFLPHLWYAGLGTLVGALVVLAGCIILWRILTPELKISRSAYDRSILKELTEMSWWVVVNMAGAMLLSRVDLIVVNMYFGAAMTGAYASLIQFTFLMEYLVTAAGSVIRPVIFIKYAQQDFKGLRNISVQSIKLLGYGMALPVGLLCGFSQPFLSLWLGPAYIYLRWLLIAILIHQALNYSVRPLLLVQNAYNKVRWPGIVTLMCGIASLVLGILFARWNIWGVIGVALAVGLTWTVKNALYMPIYTARIMELKWWAFFPSLSSSIIGTLFVLMISYGITLIKMPDNWFALIGMMIIVSILYILIVWFLGLNRNDRKLIINLIPSFKQFQKIIPTS